MSSATVSGMGDKRRLHDKNVRHDPAYLKAKAENYAGRAVYKLQELDKRFRLLKQGMNVLDLGCWPGSWLQYVSERIGDDGKAVGIDLKEVEIALPESFVTIVGDVYKLKPEKLGDRYGPFDLVISDMAPNTIGDRPTDQWGSEEVFFRALDIAEVVLRPGGHFAGKIFQGGRFPDALKRVKDGFQECKAFRPKGTRPGSIEQYIVGRGRRRPRPEPEPQA